MTKQKRHGYIQSVKFVSSDKILKMTMNFKLVLGNLLTNYRLTRLSNNKIGTLKYENKYHPNWI